MSRLDNFKGRGNTNGLDKNPQNINKNGRPRKLNKLIYLENGISAYDPNELKQIFALQLAMTEDELKELIDNPEVEMIDKISARALIKAKSKGDTRYAMDLLDHVMGKPKTSADIKINTDLTVDGMKQAADKYRKMLAELKGENTTDDSAGREDTSATGSNTGEAGAGGIAKG